ncbi:glycoside hydrolase family 32 protein [Metabacillus sp. B2-18]|uniref:glycoside hydrolase family 32 protein n=1 Tax=Metabacillus sp. B2-18 TaxID=2897333 RepID=UPI001E5B2DAD|nr:GH32 C-terminal domain-containing protein [Metabacillus sp. B2-18]UGB30637.1 GH32 C-terminal domain-containing protein [Metabacillus sp. B2-18]
MNKLQKANEYIQQNKNNVNNRPIYHFSPEIGWMNDPNGFTFYQGKYHLFYQYYPYDIVWSDMHWGHAVTENFIDWEYLPVAMANDKAYDANGCFSGSAIEKDGKLYVMYTGHVDPNLGFDKVESEIAERQCIASSEDGITFEKHKLNPVIGEKQLPEGYLICDFRDPKVIEVNGVYYCVLSVRNAQRRGEIIMFKSLDLVQWTYHSSIFQSTFEENKLLECPDLFKVDEKDVLLFSEMPCDPEYTKDVPNTTAYLIGKMDFERGKFTPDDKGLLDYGQTFYAPQSTEGKDGERLLIGWMHRWNQTNPPKEYGFNGMMSLPRKLNVINERLVQQPFIDTQNYFSPSVIGEIVQLTEGEEMHIEGKTTGFLEVVVPKTSGEFTIKLNKEGEKSTNIKVDVENNVLLLSSDYGDEGNIKVEDLSTNSDENIKLSLYIDLHSIELFINSGEKVVSFTAYDRDKGKDIMLVGGEKAELKRIVYGGR